MKIISWILSATILTICIFSCSAPTALYNSENLSQTGFSQYKTYAFMPTTDTAYAKMFDKKRLETLMSVAAVKELNKKGMKIDTANPDCFFKYTLVVNRNYELSQQQNVVYNPEVFTPAFNNNAQVYMFSSNNRPVTYGGKYNIDTLREGSLVIDMVDTKHGNVVWRSTMQGKTKETYQQPSAARIDDIIHEMFKKFPKK